MACAERGPPALPVQVAPATPDASAPASEPVRAAEAQQEWPALPGKTPGTVLATKVEVRYRPPRRGLDPLTGRAAQNGSLVFRTLGVCIEHSHQRGPELPRRGTLQLRAHAPDAGARVFEASSPEPLHANALRCVANSVTRMAELSPEAFRSESFRLDWTARRYERPRMSHELPYTGTGPRAE